jgi:SAM-dependent methyltransferase
MPANNYESLKKYTKHVSQKEVAGMFDPMPSKLNIGCGSDLRRDYINIDCIDMSPDEPYLQLDLEVARLPFLANSLDEVFAAHILEHLHNFPKLLNEIHRVLKPNGTVTVHVPCYPAVECFQDPTHVRMFTDKTFEYFTEGAFMYKHCGESYGYKGWKRVLQRRINGWELVVLLTK